MQMKNFLIDLVKYIKWKYKSSQNLDKNILQQLFSGCSVAQLAECLPRMHAQSLGLITGTS